MIGKFIKNKNTLLVIIGILFALMIFFSGALDSSATDLQQGSNATKYDSEELKTYTERLEEKIALFLDGINGISNVSVILTVESSSETVYATQGENSDYVLIKDAEGNENAIPLTEISAKIRGIAIVCNYGKNESLKLEVIELLSKLFNVGSNRISLLSA